MLYLERPDMPLRWAGGACCDPPVDTTISASTPHPLPDDAARAAYRRMIERGERAMLYRKVGKRLVLAL